MSTTKNIFARGIPDLAEGHETEQHHPHKAHLTREERESREEAWCDLITLVFRGWLKQWASSHSVTEHHFHDPNSFQQYQSDSTAEKVTSWFSNWICSREVSLSTENDLYDQGSSTEYEGTRTSTQQNSSNNKKRKCGQSQQKNRNGPHDQEAGDDGSSDEPSSVKVRQSGNLRLACHFFKRNPMRYLDSKSCIHHWPNTARIKDHLLKHHMLESITCARCGTEFSSNDEWQIHQRQPVTCTLRDFEPIEGIDVFTKGKIKSKSLARACTEKEKWLAIYEILFPSDDPKSYPDPYWDSLMSFHRSQMVEQLQAEMPHILRQSVHEVSAALPCEDIENLAVVVPRRIMEFLQRSYSSSSSLRPTETEISHTPSSELQGQDSQQTQQDNSRQNPETTSDHRNAEVWHQFLEDLDGARRIPDTLSPQLDEFLANLDQFQAPNLSDFNFDNLDLILPNPTFEDQLGVD
ncbi:hypothetical protein F5Y16DRAFT_145989 [Xylariaceae sp. FL0255]|nr:hypothetical protein F5Y16DRAFT_145989 [Xylariaceae sp. FL0255]